MRRGWSAGWATRFPTCPAAEVIDAYRAARRARGESIEANDVWVAIGTDIVFRWPSLQLAAAHVARGSRAYVYLFDWESPAFGGILGSCHALELPFVFGAVHLPVVQVFSGAGPAVEKLSVEMQRAWLAFAATGDPAHERIGSWRQWDPAVRATMIFGADTRLENAPRERGAGRPGAASPARVGRARVTQGRGARRGPRSGPWVGAHRPGGSGGNSWRTNLPTPATAPA